MWSGRFVHLTQSWNNYKCLDHNATTWMDQLQQSGYRTLSLGKLDFKSGSHSVRWKRIIIFKCIQTFVSGFVFWSQTTQSPPNSEPRVLDSFMRFLLHSYICDWHNGISSMAVEVHFSSSAIGWRPGLEMCTSVSVRRVDLWLTWSITRPPCESWPMTGRTQTSPQSGYAAALHSPSPLPFTWVLICHIHTKLILWAPTLVAPHSAHHPTGWKRHCKGISFCSQPDHRVY